MALSPSQRRLRGQIGALTLHATHNTLEVSAPGRARIFEKFVEQAREQAAKRGEVLTDEEAERRGKLLRRAHMARLSLEAAKKRSERAAAS